MVVVQVRAVAKKLESNEGGTEVVVAGSDRGGQVRHSPLAKPPPKEGSSEGPPKSYQD